MSHFVGLGFPKSFDYTGTRDNTAWLAIPAALKFFRALDPTAAWAYESRLVEIYSALMSALGAQPVGPTDMCAAMRTFMLPQTRSAAPDDGAILMRDLWKNERIQISSGVLDGRLLMRVSTQVYVAEEDLQRLTDTLDRTGWPGR